MRTGNWPGGSHTTRPKVNCGAAVKLYKTGQKKGEKETGESMYDSEKA